MKKRFLTPVLTAFLTITVLGGPLVPYADARPGQGTSMGSRGGRTWSAPPSTSTTPYGASPMDRSITPRSAPPGYNGYAGQNNYGAPYNRGMGGAVSRHPFLSGFAGGCWGLVCLVC